MHQHVILRLLLCFVCVDMGSGVLYGVCVGHPIEALPGPAVLQCRPHPELHSFWGFVVGIASSQGVVDHQLVRTA